MARLGRSQTALPGHVAKAARQRQAAERGQLEPVRARLFEKAELPCRSRTVAAPLRALKDDAQRCRIAHDGLGLGVRELAELADASSNTISRLEGSESLCPCTVETIRHVLEAAGAVLVEENGGGPGVRMAKSGDPL